MNLCWKTILWLYIVVPGPAFGRCKWLDDFSTSELNRGVWCPCQINMNTGSDRVFVRRR